jgi:hypothetical protein
VKFRNATYWDHIVALDTFVMIKFSDDTMIKPPESAVSFCFTEGVEDLWQCVSRQTFGWKTNAFPFLDTSLFVFLVVLDSGSRQSDLAPRRTSLVSRRFPGA